MSRPDAWLCVTADGSQKHAVTTQAERNIYALAGRTIHPLYLRDNHPEGFTAADMATAAADGYRDAERYING